MVSTSKIEYVQSGQLIAASYVKNSKAIGFLWGVFSVCYAIITIVVFIQPQWIGTRPPAAPGYFGLWRHCSVATHMSTADSSANTEFVCRGRLDDFSTLLNPAFRAATAFIGIATIVTILSVFALVLFVCAPTTVSYHIVAWMQTVSAICIGIALALFPAGWDAPEIKAACGNTDRYDLGGCSIRWAYILAIIAFMDGIVLAVLGFVLGSRHIKLTDEFAASNSYGTERKLRSLGSAYHTGSGYFHPTDSGPTPSVTMSYASTKRSLQPIVLIPPEADCYSEFSRSNKASMYRAEYATSGQNFQL